MHVGGVEIMYMLLNILKGLNAMNGRPNVDGGDSFQWMNILWLAGIIIWKGQVGREGVENVKPQHVVENILLVGGACRDIDKSSTGEMNLWVTISSHGDNRTMPTWIIPWWPLSNTNPTHDYDPFYLLSMPLPPPFS